MKHNRSLSIGGSEIGAIIGQDRFKTPFDVWLSKVQPTENPASYVMDRGTFLEEFIARKFEAETGSVVTTPPQEVYYHNEYDFISATPDRFYDANKVLECKHTTQHVTDPLPAHYAQLQWYLGVLGMKSGSLAYDTPFEFRVFNFDLDVNFYNYLIEKARWFWTEFVLTKTAPTYSIKDSSFEANDDLFDKYAELKTLQKNVKFLNEQIDELQLSLQSALKDNEYLMYNDTMLASWKTQTQNRIDSKLLKESFPEIYSQVVKPSTSRIFRVR